jgi:hypothetical protein
MFIKSSAQSLKDYSFVTAIFDVFLSEEPPTALLIAQEDCMLFTLDAKPGPLRIPDLSPSWRRAPSRNGSAGNWHPDGPAM